MSSLCYTMWLYKWSVNWINNDDKGRTPLHACILSKKGKNEKKWHGIVTAELLIQNGFKSTVVDEYDQTVLQIAMDDKIESEMTDYITTRLSSWIIII